MKKIQISKNEFDEFLSDKISHSSKDSISENIKSFKELGDISYHIIISDKHNDVLVEYQCDTTINDNEYYLCGVNFSFKKFFSSKQVRYINSIHDFKIQDIHTVYGYYIVGNKQNIPGTGIRYDLFIKQINDLVSKKRFGDFI